MRTKLIVLIRPYFIEQLKDNQSHEFVEQYAIEYQAEGFPEPSIQWTRNNEIIPSTSNEFRIEKNRLILVIDNERIKVSKVGPVVKLVIDECQLTDDGRYQAETNGKTSKANVIVKGKNSLNS